MSDAPRRLHWRDGGSRPGVIPIWGFVAVTIPLVVTAGRVHGRRAAQQHFLTAFGFAAACLAAKMALG